MKDARLRGRAWFGAGAFALAAAGVAVWGAAGLVERPLADALLRIAPAPAAADGVPDVAVVLLDAASLRAQGSWPWPRSRHAQVVDRLNEAGVRAIALDIAFSEPSADPAEDAALAEALRRSGAVVLASFRDIQRQGPGVVEIVHPPVPELAAAAAAVGSVLLPLDGDGVVRRAATSARIGGRILESLPAAALVLAAGVPADDLGSPEYRIDYRRAAPLERIRVGDVLEGRFDPARLRGRVVFVGASAAEFQDLWSTPVDPLLPGVEIQALAYRTLAARLAGQSVLRDAPSGLTAGFVLLCSALAAAASRLPRRGRGLAAGGVAAGTAAAVWIALHRFGIQLDLVVPLVAVAGQYGLGLESLRAWLSGVAASRERSLVLLEGVAETTRHASGERTLDAALGLLSDVVGAQGVALLRASEGALDGRRVEWRRHDDTPVGDSRLAAATLAEEGLRVQPASRPGLGETVYVPLRANQTPVGVLIVACAPGAPLDASQLRTISTAASQLALSAENVRLLEELRDTFDAAIAAIATAVEERDGYTELHCRRLAGLSALMAENLELPEKEVEAIRIGALLHDVGKIGIRDDILLKPGRFTPEERREMERHPELGHRIVAPIPGLTETTAACVRHHHERWDGHGYPHGLAGSAIPLGARIVSIVDVWDALSTARPYKQAWPTEKVLDLLDKGRGSQFDSELVDLFLRVLEEQGHDLVAAIDADVEQRG